MGKRQFRNKTKADDDAVLMSGFEESVDYETFTQAMERDDKRRRRIGRKAVRNRFDDYEEDQWVRGRSKSWDEYADFESDLDFEDYPN